MLFFAMLLSVIVASAKDIKTVVFTTNPVMHCANCENKIKSNLRFEKGVKTIETNVAQQRVTVGYDASKTDAATLQKAFGKFGYEAKVVGDAAKADGCKAGKGKGEGCKAGKAECKNVKGEGCKAQQKPSCCQDKEKKAEASCCQDGKQKKAEGSCCQAKPAEKKDGCGGCQNK